jgi:Zn-dependent peptidase ImmA (M78 family)
VKRGLPVHPEIGQAAERILRESGPPRLDNGIGIDVVAIIREFCNLEVAWISGLRPMGKALLGLYVPQFRAVLVENECHPHRQRFSLAHELGHAQLQDDFGDADSLFDVQALQMVYFCDAADMSAKPDDERSRGRRRRLEVRANQFAGELLMPTGLVKEVWPRYRDVRKCGELLGVSKQSLEIRLQQLNLGSATYDGSSRRLL